MSQRRTNILLVKDNADHIWLTVEALRDGNVPDGVFVVEDGEEALDFLYGRGKYAGENKPPRPDLILLDIKLPKVDGLEVLERIKSDPELKPIPVVMLTTSEQEEEIARRYTTGANSYVTKPASFDEPVRKVREVELCRLPTNTPPYQSSLL